MALPLHPQLGALAHLVERNTGSVEVSGSSPLCSTTQEKTVFHGTVFLFVLFTLVLFIEKPNNVKIFAY